MKDDRGLKLFLGIVCFLVVLMVIPSSGFCLTISGDNVELNGNIAPYSTTITSSSPGFNITNNAGDAIRGVSSDTGVYGSGTVGIWGSGSTGVYGTSGPGTGVYGSSTSGWAGYFQGNVNVTGQVTAGTFSGNGAGLTNIVPAAGTVSTDKIVSSNVTSDKIASGAVTAAKLASNAVFPVNVAFYSNVAVVAPSGGDYNNPATAMSNYSSWCGTPSATNPCLLKIMPGVYNIGTSCVQMQPYIDIEGSGENVTIIKSGNTSQTDVVRGASNAELRFCNIQHTLSSNNNYVIAIYNPSGTSTKITNVTVSASGGISNTYAIWNDGDSIMNNVTATASGGTVAYGVYNQSSSPVMNNVTASASGGDSNCGVYNNNVINSSPIMNNVTATGSGGTYASGVHNWSGLTIMTNVTATAKEGTNNFGVYNSYASPVMTNVTTTGTGGTDSSGLRNEFSGTVKINHSVIKGGTNTIWNGSGVTARVGNTQLDGPAVSNAGTLTCAGVYDENYAFYASTCP